MIQHQHEIKFSFDTPTFRHSAFQLRYMKISGRVQVYKITKSRDTEKPTLAIKTASEDPNQPAHTRSIIGILTIRKELQGAEGA